MASERDSTGLAGEKLAEKHLAGLGYKCIARRYRAVVGELDLVFLEGRTVVFVEVKTQQSDRLIDPEARVTRTKQTALLKVARWFLREKKLEDRPCRFDVVSVILAKTAPPEIRHIRDAFAPTRW